MNAIIRPSAVQSLMLSYLLRGQSASCVRNFGRVEQAIWSCVAGRVSAQEIADCIRKSLDPDLAKKQADSVSPITRTLAVRLEDALESMSPAQPALLNAYCDDVLRFAATVWQSWQDGYDAGWEDHFASTVACAERLDS